MYKSKNISVVVPAYNEEKQIENVILTMPKFVDRIVIVDDKSTDKTVQIVSKLIKKNRKIILIQHKKNEGVGGAIASGYKWCKNNNTDVSVVMAGDGQMLPKDLKTILDPVADGQADYSKANRLLSGNAFTKIPK